MFIPPFNATWRDPGTVTPFTTRTNASYLKILYDLRDYITGPLTEAINSEFDEQFTNITGQVDALIAQLNAHALELEEDMAEVETKLNAAIAAANAAAASASAAGTSATNSANSATSAETSKVEADASADAAAASATAAATSAADASTAGAAAGTTAGAAAGAAAASPYATAAASSATAAATSATNAGNSATAAATSATNAGTAATAAVNSQKDANNGIPGLDGNGKIKNAQLPARIQSTDPNNRSATDLAALTAIADGVIGDRVRVINPGTGITPFWATLHASPGSSSSKWRPDGQITADTLTNLNNFITAWTSDADLTFRIGGEAFVTADLGEYIFTATNGDKTSKKPNITLRRSANFTLTTAGSAYAIPFDVEISDIDGMHATTPSTVIHEINIPRTGLWEIEYGGLFVETTSGSCWLVANINGTVNTSTYVLTGGTDIPGSKQTQNGTAVGVSLSRSVKAPLTQGDKLYIVGRCSSAAIALTGGTVADAIVASVRYIGPA